MSIEKKSPFTAGLFSFLTPGLGQLYTNQPKPALFFAAGAFVVLPLLIISICSTFGGLLVTLAFCAVLYLASIVNAASMARSGNFNTLPWYTKWYSCLLIIVFLAIPSALLKAYIRLNHIQAYRFTNTSMSPALMPGEQIIVDQSFYSSNQPSRGDIVVLRLPDDPSTANDESSVSIVKRVVAIGGDRIAMKKDELQLNGTKLQEPYATYELGGRKGLTEQVVPEGRMFLLGDNRDLSKDSRFWHVTFPETARLEGKVRYVYWANDWSRIGKSFE